MEELLPIVVVGLGALIFSKQGNAAPAINPYASVPNSTSYMGSGGAPYLTGVPSAGGMLSSPYGVQPAYGYGYGYQQPNQMGAGLVNLATGVINKLPSNILSSAATTAAKNAAASDAIVSGAISTPVTEGSVIESTLPALGDVPVSDAVVSSVVEDSSTGAFGLPSISDALGLPSLSETLGIGDAGVVSDVVDFLGDWGW